MFNTGINVNDNMFFQLLDARVFQRRNKLFIEYVNENKIIHIFRYFMFFNLLP